MTDKQRFIELLKSTDRSGMENLIQWMEISGFFTAPCSVRHHLAEPGGLLKHSLNVYNTAQTVKNALNMRVKEDSLRIACLLHDLGKSGQFGKPLYVEKLLKNGKPGVEPYQINSELPYIDHEIRSIAIASQYIRLTEDEQFAIVYHNGKYTHVGYSLQNETPLQIVLHFADMYSSRCIER